MKEMNHYQTTDIFFASFLIAAEYSNLKDIIDNGVGRKVFIFEPAPSQEVILGFYNGSETVSAIRLFEVFQSLKSATFVVQKSNQKHNERR
jgi:hypothetical protein